jgi:hypothetical protein
MVTELEAWQIDSDTQMPIHKPNKRYNWNNTTTKQWEKFSEQIEQQITTNSILKQKISTDQRWNIFRQILSQAASNNISKTKPHRKQHINEETSGVTNLIHLQLFLNNIKRTIQNPAVFTLTNLMEKMNNLELHFQSLCTDLTNLQSTNPTNFPKLWETTITNYIRQHKAALQILTNHRKRKQIIQHISRRQESLKDNKKAMINSILERPRRCITLDRIIIQNEQDIQIITNPPDILTKVAQHYKAWTSYRQTKPLYNFPEWQQEYKPKDNISSSCY